MNYIKQLEELLINDVLIEVNETITELEKLSLQKKSKAIKEELNYIKEVKKYFDEVLLDIENNSITQEQALDILEGLEDMRIENQEI